MRWENPVDRVPETRNCDQQVHWLSSLPIHGEIVQDKFVAHLESRVEFVCVCPEAEWVVPVPERGLTISPDGNTFTLEMQNVWKSTCELVRYEDPSKHFRFIGTRASNQLEAQVEVPSVGFSWKSDPLNTSKSDFAVIGEEVNGRYYDT